MYAFDRLKEFQFYFPHNNFSKIMEIEEDDI